MAGSRRSAHVAYLLVGLPGVGKTTVGRALADRIDATMVEADEARRLLWPHLGYSERDRRLNQLMLSLVCGHLRSLRNLVVATIAPYRRERDVLARLIRARRIVHLEAPLEVLRERDPKGLYAAQAAGRLTGLTGVDAPFDVPTGKDVLRLRTDLLSVEECIEEILQ